MNTLQELLDSGIELHTAKMMLDEYNKRIGCMNGVYKITDINYDFNIRGKIIALECQECGKVIYRTMISGRNKWSELIKSCECQKIREREAKKAECENFLKNKKAEMIQEAYGLIGSEYGDYKIISVGRNNEKLLLALECKTCGEIISVPYQSIKNNAEKYKKCTKHYNPIKFDETYIGKKNNFLKVIGITRLPNKHRAFLCECDCGNITTIEPVFWEQGIVKSCGCMHDILLSEKMLKHGYSKMRIYSVWWNMIDRCKNPKNKNYSNYGKRGICVCPEWEDVECFIKWAYANGYDENAARGQCTLDRIDVNGNYGPSNCRWITIQEQNKNKRPSCEWKKRDGEFEYEGKNYLLSELCKMFNTSEPALRYRMVVRGMTLKEALEIPKSTIGRPRKEV